MNYNRYYSNIFNNVNLDSLPITFTNNDYTTFINNPDVFNYKIGNIGINTDSPKYNLDVSGTIKCSNLILNNKEFNLLNIYTSNGIFNNTVYWDKIINIQTKAPLYLDTNNNLKLNYNSNIFEINKNKLSIKGLTQDTFSGKISNISNIKGINIINSNISNLLENDTSNVRIINISNSLSILNLSNANNDTMLRMTDSTTGFSSKNGLIIGKNTNNDCVFWNYYNSDIIFRTTENNLFYSIFQKKIPWGIYFAEDYDSSVNLLYNYIKNNNKNAICTGTINKLWGNGNGANSNINYISGSTTSTIDFGTSSLPANFTICSLTRYNGATKKRIITGNNINFLHGHSSGNKGVCYYQDNWKNISSNINLGNQDNWLCCIGRNNNSIPMNIICNGIPVGGNIGGIGSGGLTINKNVTNSETSTWAFSLLMIWDQHLTNEEVFYLNKLVNNYINNGISIKKMIDSAENLKISNNGNIGIGVANPTSLCNINGHITTKLYYYSRTTTTIPSNTSSFSVCFSTLIQDLNMNGVIITYTSDVTNGDYFQINKTGLYLINVMLGNTNSNAYFWIDKNNINTDDCLINANTLFVKSKIDSNDESISFRGVLNNNDIIRIKSGFITNLITSNRYTLNITYLMETI